MAQADGCLCPGGLGQDNCDNQTGIAQLWWQSPKQISAMTYNADDKGCCPLAEIATIVMDKTSPTPLDVELFQTIDFVNQDDNTGALLDINTTNDAGNTSRNRTFTFQVNANSVQGECILDKMVGREIVLVVKFKNGQYKAINQEGGMRVASVVGNSNQSYYVVTVSGVPNAIDKYIDATWAEENMVPVSIDPDGIVASAA